MCSSSITWNFIEPCRSVLFCKTKRVGVSLPCWRTLQQGKVLEGWTSWKMVSLKTHACTVNPPMIWIGTMGKHNTVQRIRHNMQQMNATVTVQSRGLLFPSSGWMRRAGSSTAVALSIWSFLKQGWNSRILASRPAGLNWLSTAYCLY